MPANAALEKALARRFGEDGAALAGAADRLTDSAATTIAGIAGRASVRRFKDQAVSVDLLRLLAATALSAPSKSDLQQSDIVIVQDPEKRSWIAGQIPTMPWVGSAPAFLVFCANNRRQRQIALSRGHAFANDHLDAFFNASVDAAIVLATFVTSAEACGLGCCPVSVVRNFSHDLSELLALPDHVFAVAGMAVGWPDGAPDISPRLGLDVTVHTDRFDEDAAAVERYDQRRQTVQPFERQRQADLFGTCADYGWSEDKARQYALAQRADFGAFIRGKGFRLD